MANPEQEILSEISEVIFPLTSKPAISCAIHQDKKAVLLCSECSDGICSFCLSETESFSRLICRNCLQKEKNDRSLLHYFRIVKFPALWVMICIVFAGIAYGMGVGNPDFEYMEQKDKDDPWYMKDAGTILFSQASRESQRAAALRYLNREHEARLWSLKASEAFAECALYWKDTPALPDLKTAEALMLGYAGDFDSAVEMLKALSVKYPDQIAVVQYHIAQLYLQNGDDKQADIHFRKAWESRSGLKSGMDNIIDGVANSMKELEMMTKVRIICHTLWTPKMNESIKKRLNLDEENSFDLQFNDKNQLKESSKEPVKAGKLKEDPKVDFEIEIIEQDD